MKRGKFEAKPDAKKSTGKKLVSLVLVLVLLLGTAIGTTLAWLVDTPDPLTNTFVVGNVDIDLTETYGEDAVGGKQFKMYPGATIVKDPVVTVNPGSSACWLFVKVEVNNDDDELLQWEIGEDWAQLTDAEGNDIPNVYYISQIPVDDDAQEGEKHHVLKNDLVTVDSSLTKEDLADYDTDPTMVITAYAIQAEGLIDQTGEGASNQIDAWMLLEAQLNAEP